MTIQTLPPAILAAEAAVSALVSKTYGEPDLHTDGDIAAIAFDPSGLLWSIDDTGALCQWSGDGKPLKRHFLSDLESLWTFGPNARHLASGNDDLLFWDVAEGELLARIKQKSWVTALAFAPDDDTVASGHDDGHVRFWSLAGKKLIGEIDAHPQPVSAIQFDPAGQRFATAGEDRLVRVWDAATHKPLGDFASHTDRIPSLAWSADSRILASAGWDTSARVWLPKTAADPVMLLNSHADQVQTLAFAPTGVMLACADSDCDITLWSDPSAAQPGVRLAGHTDEIRSLAFSPDGTRLASAGVDRVIHVWDVREGKLVAGPGGKPRNDIAFVPGPAPMLASAGGSSVRLWDATSGDGVPGFDDAPLHTLAASPDGRWLALGGTDHFTRLYDLTAPGSAPTKLEATKPPIGALAFSPDGSLLVQTSPADGLVWLWTTATKTEDLILIEAADGCTLEAIAVDGTGQFIAVGGADILSTGERDGAVCVWDRTTKLKAATFDHGVYALAFDPQGRFLAGAGLDDCVYVWDPANEREAFRLEGHDSRVGAIAFSPDGNYLVSGSDDGTLRIWDVLTGRLIALREFDSPLLSLAFGDGGWLYSGNGNTTCSRYEFAKLIND